MLQRVGPVVPASTHLVEGICGQRVLVGEACAALGQRLLVQLLAVAIDVESLAHLVRGECAPADDHLPSVADGHDTTVERLTVQLLEIIFGLGRSSE